MSVRTSLLAAALAATLPSFGVAQVPPELLGLGTSTRDTLSAESLGQPAKSGWVQRSTGTEGGLGCVVIFVTVAEQVGDTFGLVGPTTPDLAEKGAGLVVFTGPRIPPPDTDGSLSQITILSGAAPNTTTAIHMKNGELNIFMVPVRIGQMLAADNPSESIAIEYQGREVYRVDIAEYNTGRVMMRDCMQK